MCACAYIYGWIERDVYRKDERGKERERERERELKGANEFYILQIGSIHGTWRNKKKGKGKGRAFIKLHYLKGCKSLTDP